MRARRRARKAETLALAVFGLAFFIAWTTFLNGVWTLPEPPTTASRNDRNDLAFTSVDAVNDLPWRVRSSYVCIRIEDNPSYYSEPHAMGEYHKNPQSPYFRMICVTSDTWRNYPEVIWHEAAHAYQDQLEREGSDFTNRWRNIAGGVITAYGRRSTYEDVAEWMRELYLVIRGCPSAINDFSRSEFLDPAGPYCQKLQLLREYGFITEFHYWQVLN